MTAPIQDVLDGETSALPTSNPSDAEPGVGKGVRIASTVLGGALLLFGVRRRTWPGTAAALVGGWLLHRSIPGRSPLPSVFGRGGSRGEGDAEPVETDVERTVTVGADADELYERWQDPEQLAQVMGHFADVDPVDEDRLHWTVHGPFGRDMEWKTRFVERRPGELLRWESVENATVPNEGSIRLRPAPGDQGTEVTLHLRFDPPGGKIGNAAMKFSGFVPAVLAKKALRRFKSLVETGEIPTLEGNPSARGRGDTV
ncbi:SRPBCC family protein [Halopelagius fulvigenes]|uniref:SRPBCC family protein n=1 Tax=Halopelagius fulvigenes TaxID=1198324 RepID=A0ABD5TZ93_9EURY